MVGLLVISCLLSAAAAQDYSGAQVLQLPEVPLVDELVRTQRLDVWSRNSSHADVLVPADKLDDVNGLLSAYGIPVGVKIPDVEEAIRASNPQSRLRAHVARSGMSWDRYHRLSEIHGFLDQLARTYPQFVSVGVLGYSHEGRPLKYIKISSGKSNAKAVWIDGGIHAREWVSPASVSWVIKELVQNRNSLPRELLDLDFYILPVHNPDGYEFSHTTDRMWRKNRRPNPGKRRACEGVDLNRNYPIHWGGKGTSKDPCTEIYVGPSPGSEPETQAVMNFVRGIRSKLVAFLTFHSYSQMILIPYAHEKNQRAENYQELLAAGNQAAAALRRVEGQRYAVGNTVDLLSEGAGGSDDWAKGDLKIRYAYCVELRDTGKHGFLLPPNFIQPTAREAFEVVKTLSSIAARS